jgi:protein ImuB
MTTPRIACLYLPGFRLQVHVARAPHLQGTAFAVANGARVEVCSRRALEAGVQVGMAAARARAVAPELQIVDAAPDAYAEAMHALGEAALGVSATVDVDEPGLVYALAGGGLAAGRLAAAAARLGLHGRVGVADDRFTAWAATQTRPRARVRVVPAGGSARFLAPLGLDLLGAWIDADVRRMLGVLGVRTLGDYAALPRPSVARRGAGGAASAQALACGHDATPLHAFVPRARARETVELEAAIRELEPLAFVLRPLIERTLVRLSGRGRAVARMALRLRDGGQTTELAVEPQAPTESARALLDLARAGLAERGLGHPVRTVEVEVLAEGEPPPAALELFRDPADGRHYLGGLE